MAFRRTRKGFAALAAASVVLAGTAALGATAHADTGNYRANDYADGQAMSILPPGENGLVNATDAVQAEAGTARPAGSNDQLPKYAGLIQGAPSLTDGTLGNYYDDESFGVQPGDIVRTETPGPGTTIYRDTHDVPHVYGTSDTAMAFGAGYAQAEDRLFLMDVLRHYGEGTVSQFLGPSCGFEEMDHDELLLSPYTTAQANAQIAALPAEYGAQGTFAVTLINGFVQGVNAYITASQTNPSLLPADYAAAVGPPTMWTPADVVGIAGVIGGIFGKGGGSEFKNAALLQYLQKQMGTAAGAQAFADFKDPDDPDAPTTIVDKSFPYETPTAVDPATTAIPDNQTLTGGPTDTTTDCQGVTVPAVPGAPALPSPLAIQAAGGVLTPAQEGASIAANLVELPKHFSNALVVNASKSSGGHPIAVFGPQVSYYAPQILMIEDLHSPDYDAEGASFPGTGLVELGRGQDYAWSATSAGTDLIDQRLEVVCDPAGGTPTADEPDYLFNGKCLPMTKEVFNDTAVTKPGGTGAPAPTLSHTIYLTNHGVVQGWTTAGGKPVALVTQRSTFNHDVDSVVGFAMWGEPALTHDAASWFQGAEKIEYTFNWFYVDDRDTAYYVSGLDPVRPANVNPALPTWGTGGSEWQGYLSDDAHPHEINPPQGFFVSWNNKPSPGFSAADDMFGYGPVYRSEMLVNALKPLVAAGNVTRTQVVQAMSSVSTQDLDGTAVLPELLSYLGSRTEPAGVTAMIAQLQSWLADGAHRVKTNPSDAQYLHAPAIAIMDELEDNIIQAVFDPILKAGGEAGSVSTGGATTPAYSVLPMQWVNTPNSGDAHLGSAYDSGYESYLVKAFEQLRGLPVAAPFGTEITSLWCGTGGSPACPAAMDSALLTTYNNLVTANAGSTDVSTWTASPALVADRTTTNNSSETMGDYDAINFRALGVVGQPAIEWQNRPTFQQVIEFPRHRPRADAAAPAAPGAATGTLTSTAAKKSAAKAKAKVKARAVAKPAQPRRTLAFTGLDSGLGMAALALLVGGLVLARRRRTV